MKKILIKSKSIWLIALLLTSLASCFGIVYADSNNPPGNNGTIKMDGSDLDGNGNDNDPHLACGLTVQWFGFDVGTRTTTVEFVTQPPTGSDNLLLTDTTTFTGSGSGNNLDFSKSYNISSQLSSYTPQDQQGYHVKLTVETDGSQGNDTKSKVFWIEPCVTAAQPDATTPNCEVQDVTVTPPTINGIVWSPSGATQLAAGQSVIYTASADDGYNITPGTQTSWSFTNDFDPSTCGQTRGDTTITVTPTAPEATEPTCQVPSQTITPPNITGVIWDPSDPTVLSSGNPSVTYTATPAPGYEFPDGVQTSWTFNYVAPSECVLGDDIKVVTPGDPDPTFIDPTCTEAGSYTVVAKEGVIYKDPNGNLIEPGTYTAVSGSTVTIIAYPANENVVFSENAQTVWTHTFNTPNCPRVLGESTTTGGAGGDPQVLASSTVIDTGTSPLPQILLGTFLMGITAGTYILSHRKPAKKQIKVNFL